MKPKFVCHLPLEWGAIAAMALPPQMAVPKEISWVMILSILKIYPRTIPKTTISVMLKTVNKKNLLNLLVMLV